MISFNTSTEEVKETEIELKKKDDFIYIHHGAKVDNLIKLVGHRHFHMVDLTSNQTTIINERGIMHAK